MRSAPHPQKRKGALSDHQQTHLQNWGCMKGPQPLHFESAGGGVYVAGARSARKTCRWQVFSEGGPAGPGQKNPEAELAPAEGFFIPIKFSGRDAKHHKK
ncbi:MAG: hypothetical protein IJS53_02250, partial [Clostridia bacterium]|nr:hypothetical protein [Clostridia bacterium]